MDFAVHKTWTGLQGSGTVCDHDRTARIWLVRGEPRITCSSTYRTADEAHELASRLLECVDAIRNWEAAGKPIVDTTVEA